MGFSMGGQEVIHASARLAGKVEAFVVVFGSIMLPLASVIGWDMCCQPCGGGSCAACSDTPVGLCGMGKALHALQVPSPFITSDLDMVKSDLDMLHDGGLKRKPQAKRGGSGSMVRVRAESSIYIGI
jgi:hypothetical protein